MTKQFTRLTGRDWYVLKKDRSSTVVGHLLEAQTPLLEAVLGGVEGVDHVLVPVFHCLKLAGGGVGEGHGGHGEDLRESLYNFLAFI